MVALALRTAGLLLAILLLGDAEAVGLILALALVNKLHRKDVTMCQRQAAEADFIGTLLLALAVQAVQRHRQAGLRQLQLHPDQPAAHVRQDIIGCLTAADGVCLTEQATDQPQQPLRQLRILRPLLQPRPSLLLLQLKHQRNLLLRQQPNPVPLRPQPVSPYRLRPILNGGD